MTTQEEYTYVGKRIPRIDALQKVTGRGQYTGDIKLPGMLHAKMLWSPVAHARIAHIDTTRAEALPGVHCVLTYKDVPQNKFNRYYREPIDLERLPFDELLLTDHVRHVGDRVAIVAAESPEIAEEALELIEVEYEELPVLSEPFQALAPDAPAIHEPDPQYGKNVVKHVEFTVGNIERGFAECDLIVEDRFSTHTVCHSPLEPHVYVASIDGQGKITIWASTHGPFNVRTVTAIALSIPRAKIRAIEPLVGGGFGGKNDVFYEPLLALMAMRTGRPVRFELTRMEEFMATPVRHAITLDIKLGFKRDGTLHARQMTAYLNTGAYASAGGKVATTVGHRWLVLYRTPHIKYDGYAIYTNCPVASAMRGFGSPQQVFATESLMDIAAERLGIDPVELRLKNHVRPGDVDPSCGYTLLSVGLDECIRRGAALIGWEEKRKHHIVSPTVRRGVGFAIGTHNSGVKPWVNELSSAVVIVNDDGSVNLLTGAADIGQGSDTSLTQICAEVLGVRIEDVVLTTADTDTTPYDIGTHSSRLTYIAGQAVMQAAQDARDQLLSFAAEMLEAKKEDLDIKDRMVYVRHLPESRISVFDVAMHAQHGENPTQILGRSSWPAPYNAPPFAAHFAEVSVDIETGQVTVDRLTAVHDIGKAINPLTIEGQIEGAIQQGIGYALSEHLVIDKDSGQPVNPSFTDYKMLAARDMPRQIEPLYVESIEPTGPFGAKGLAEPALVPTAAAIANAVANATGVRIKELPITPEKVLAGLRALEDQHGQNPEA